MEELIPQNRQEAMLRNIALAAGGEAVTEELVPQWDDEKFLDDILKAAQGESPVYNIEPRWHHQKFYKAIADALASSGGGYELVGSEEFEVNTSSTSGISVGYVTLDTGKLNKDSILVTVIRDKAGKRDGYFLSSINIAIGTDSPSRRIVYVRDNEISSDNGLYGVYANSASSSSESGGVPYKVQIKAKYGSAIGTINGTFLCEVYTINPPVDVFSGDPIE